MSVAGVHCEVFNSSAAAKLKDALYEHNRLYLIFYRGGQMRIRFPSKGMTLALFFSVFSVLVLVGCRGPQGNAGLPGAAGNPGNAGLQGQAGEPGLSGFPGEPGNVGSQGIQGVQGIQGEQGSPGVSPEAQIMLSESTLTLDEPLQVWGSGFLPGEPVTLLLVVDAINNWVVGGSFDDRPVANASGAFAMSLDSIRGSISGSTIGSKRQESGQLLRWAMMAAEPALL